MIWYASYGGIVPGRWWASIAVLFVVAKVLEVRLQWMEGRYWQ